MRRSLRESLVHALRSLRTMVTALCLAAAGWTQAAPAVPDLDAVVSYETRQITAARPETVVILLSTYQAADLPSGADDCGAARYVNKEEFGPAVIVDAWSAHA